MTFVAIDDRIYHYDHYPHLTAEQEISLETMQPTMVNGLRLDDCQCEDEEDVKLWTRLFSSLIQRFRILDDKPLENR